MVRSRPPSTTNTRSGPRRRHRGGLFTLAGALTLCGLVACALSVPLTVLGAEPDGSSPSNAPSGTSSIADSPGFAAADRLELGLTPSPGTLLTTLPWGTGPLEVGLVRPVEGLTRGPEALAVSPDGRLAILDSVNHRVLFLDASGSVTGSAALDLSEPRFLAVDDQRVCVLDCDRDRRLLMLDWTGSNLGETELPELPDFVTGLFLDSSGPLVEVAHQTVYRVDGALVTASGSSLSIATAQGSLPARGAIKPVDGRPAGRGTSRSVSAVYSMGRNPLITVRGGAASSSGRSTTEVDLGMPRGRTIDQLISIDGDGRDGLLVGALVSPLAGSTTTRLVLRRFAVENDNHLRRAVNPGGRSSGDALVLDDTSIAYVGQPYVVAPDGRVFQPVAADSGYSIYVHVFADGSAPVHGKEVLP